MYCNGKADKEAFDGKLEFDVKVLPYDGDDSWVEPKIIEAHQCLMSAKIPAPGDECDYCLYRKDVRAVTASFGATDSKNKSGGEGNFVLL